MKNTCQLPSLHIFSQLTVVRLTTYLQECKLLNSIFLLCYSNCFSFTPPSPSSSARHANTSLFAAILASVLPLEHNGKPDHRKMDGSTVYIMIYVCSVAALRANCKRHKRFATYDIHHMVKRCAGSFKKPGWFQASALQWQQQLLLYCSIYGLHETEGDVYPVVASWVRTNAQ